MSRHITPTGLVNFALLVAIGVVAYHFPFSGARGLDQDFRNDHQFIRGDANDDISLDISDPIRVLSFLFVGDEAPPCLAAADADDDGEVALNDAVIVLNHLFQGERPPAAPYPEAGIDPTPDLGCREPAIEPLPAVGSLGGPDRELSEEEATLWRLGRRLFLHPTAVDSGLGPIFNGDSCRSCHLDPVIGGAGGLDVNVVRFAYRDESQVVSQMDGGPAASRGVVRGFDREELPEGANVVETRQTPTILGLGLVDRVPDENLLANADPDDLDGDGISGRALIVNGGVSRFGHKCAVPTVEDFTADALINEIGTTISGHLSAFAGSEDDDAAADPEMSDQEFEQLAFFVSHLAPPPRQIPDDPNRQRSIEEGEALFETLGCGGCHVPTLEGADGEVHAYSDFLLHDVANPNAFQVNEPGVEPREFRTAPLWGIVDTAPYLHDGSAESLDDAILHGHFGEAEAARNAYSALSFIDKLKLEDFLDSL